MPINFLTNGLDFVQFKNVEYVEVELVDEIVEVEIYEDMLTIEKVE